MLIRHLNELKTSYIYEKFEVQIQLAINHANSSLNELTSHIICTLEELLDSVAMFLAESVKHHGKL
jgi:hypothetical protein